MNLPNLDFYDLIEDIVLVLIIIVDDVIANLALVAHLDADNYAVLNYSQFRQFAVLK